MREPFAHKSSLAGTASVLVELDLGSLGKARAGKGACELSWGDITDWAEGLFAIFVRDQVDERCEQQHMRLRLTFPGRSYLALTLRRRPDDVLRLHLLAEQAAAHLQHEVVPVPRTVLRLK
ncbi:hypothetical protein GBZ48_07335 [Azospirillum melinis]|uniref:Uncharacterized protein n=1 Tax=Azospirillum melinis TaxID=328839 RepID=A0ABX2KCL5_9PROT|nr:hypothetical protein [Azospirillum melinis]NUA99095.1 hypothetical protein [Azospirillum melinis]